MVKWVFDGKYDVASRSGFDLSFRNALIFLKVSVNQSAHKCKTHTILSYGVRFLCLKFCFLSFVFRYQSCVRNEGIGKLNPHRCLNRLKLLELTF